MRICPKCSKQISEGRTICRDCGGILEEVSDDELPKELSPSCPPSRPEGETRGGSKSLAKETSEALDADKVSPAELDAHQVETIEGLDWKCEKCSETVPGTFDVCWKCMSISEGRGADQTELGLLEPVSDASDDGQEVESAQECADPLGIEGAEKATTIGGLNSILEDGHDSDALACPFCGDKMIRGHIWVSGGEGSSNLEWQGGSQLESGLFGKSVDETLLSDGWLVAPAKQAFRCISCQALLTNFKDTN